MMSGTFLALPGDIRDMMPAAEGRGEVATKGKSLVDGGLSILVCLFMSAVVSAGKGKTACH